MGDFLLYHKDRIAEGAVQNALSSLSKQGSVNPRHAGHHSYVLQVFPKQKSPLDNFFEDEQGNFCGSSGCFIYKGHMGKAALTSFLADFSPDRYEPGDFSGLFTLIIRKNDRLHLITDPMGGNRVYQNDTKNLWSSSFLSAASASDQLTPNPQAIYEYAFQETTYGVDTVFKEVTCLDSLKIFEVTPDGLIARPKNLAFDFSPSSASCPQLVEEAAALLRDGVKPVANVFGDKIRTALSGGYDSRLMLALLQDSGSRPQVYVYGPDDSPDVRVAKNISAGAGFPLHHINKADYPRLSGAEYAAAIEDNFYGLDGLPGEGIFDFGANMDTRRQRADHGHMVFNGGGGEIFRNFFYLPQGRFTINGLINCFYSRYSTSICQDVFNEQDYRDALHDKIQAALGATSDLLNREQVEYAYPAFRLRYWTARDNNNNTRLGPYLTPFISYPLIRLALTIPLAYKNHGVFQAAVIAAISPELAAYPSDYGYAFDAPVPLKVKIKNYMTYYRPTILRRYSYAIQHRMRDLALPDTLAGQDKNPHMSRYFKLDEIKDAGLLGRVYTLEYLFTHFGL